MREGRKDIPGKKKKNYWSKKVKIRVKINSGEEVSGSRGPAVL